MVNGGLPRRLESQELQLCESTLQGVAAKLRRRLMRQERRKTGEESFDILDAES